MKLTINEKEYPLQWGMGAIEMYCDAMFCDLEGLELIFIEGRNQGRAIINLILAALKNAQEIENETLEVTYRQLQRYLDEAPQETMKLIMDDFKDSKYFGKTIEQYFLQSVQIETDGTTNSTKKKLD